MVGVAWYTLYIHTYIPKGGPRWRRGYFEEPLGREGGKKGVQGGGVKKIRGGWEERSIRR